MQIRIDRLNTYTERSYSGTGIHSYGLMDASKIPTYEKDGKLKLDKAFYQKNPNNNMELALSGAADQPLLHRGLYRRPL